LPAVESAKIGRCPPRPFGAGRARFCSSDNQCPGRKKCCLVKQGYACTTPAFYYPNQHIPPRDHTKPITRPSEKEKPGTCPPTNIFTGKAPFCKRDSDCEGSQKCCLTKAGNQCVQPLNEAQKAKPGTCPPYPFGPVGAAMFCQTDFDCKGTQKCCMTKVGYDCTPPAEESQEVNKPGECPAEPTIAGKALFCRSDKDCDGSEKCCLTKVGKECVKPVQKPAQNAKPGTCPPYPMGPVGAALFCQTDDDCQGTQKCCMTKVGYDCTAPVEESQEVNKPGECPAEPPFSGRALFCRSDKDCDGSEKCCVTKVGKECVTKAGWISAGQSAKPGTCPPYPMGPVGAALFCQTDDDCQGSQKCCMTKVGYDCTAPMEESEEVNKPGECPAEPPFSGRALFCRSDKDCDGPEKCCVTKVGKECVKPVEPRPVSKKGSCPPKPTGPSDNQCPGRKKCCLVKQGYACTTPAFYYPRAAMFCQTDFDCKGTQKCCMTKVGYDCTPPAEESQEVNKPGECPAEPTIAGKALFCRSDKDCDGSEKCCLTKVGKECVKPVQKPVQNAKPGTCPPYPMGPVGAALFCQTDDDCQGSQKCCMTKVGYDCTAPMEETVQNAKPGTCPPYPMGPVGAALFCQTDDDCQGSQKCCMTKAASCCTRALFCRSDKDCDGSEKCCVTKVGKECVKPVQKPGQSAKPGTCPPYPMGPVGAALFCQTDDDCQGSQKCCMTKVGYDCTAPMEESEEVNKPGECPAEPPFSGRALFCRSDKDCDGPEKCCVTKVGKECVKPVEPRPVSKKGSCPPKPTGPIGLANFCESDFDCEGSMKCCITSVGYDCTSPVEESLRPSKRGICPWPSSVMEKGRLCSSDGDCQGSRKCCPTKAGNACVKPVSEELAGGRGTCPPAAYVMGLPGSCRRDKDCEDGKKCCDGVDGKSCSVLVLANYMREQWKEWMANGQESYTAGGRMRAPSLSLLCQLAINAWSKVKMETVMMSFRKCSISTALDGTEDDGPSDSDEDPA
ncbi:hypothetical protein M514_27849, partial [Trichuris suis]